MAAAIAASLEQLNVEGKEEEKKGDSAHEQDYILNCMGQNNRVDPASLDDLDSKSIPAEESSSPEKSDQKNNTSKKEQKVQQFLRPDQQIIIASKFNVDSVEKDENLIEL